MSDRSGLLYLFEQLNLNGRQNRWLATISEFDFEIMYIKGKENRVADSLSMQIQVNHLAALSFYGIDLHDRILQAGQQDVRYMEIMHRLQQSIGKGTCTCGGTCIGTCDGIGAGIGSGTSIGTGANASAHDVNYCLTADGLIRFNGRSVLKHIILLIRKRTITY